MPSTVATRGEVWLADLSPVRGHEQAGRRPVLVVSVNAFNESRADLIVVIPITSTLRNIPFHVEVQPPHGGLTNPSALLCEAVRSISKDRLITRWGKVSQAIMTEAEDRAHIASISDNFSHSFRSSGVRDSGSLTSRQA